MTRESWNVITTTKNAGYGTQRQSMARSAKEGKRGGGGGGGGVSLTEQQRIP
jgi:hypothetical protein